MKPIQDFNQHINVLFTDIDDTLTFEGRLPAKSYEMLWKLAEAGIDVIPVTGRPAGWCEMIARMWPVPAIIGENGAFYFEYANKKMNRIFATNEESRIENQKKLKLIEKEVLSLVPGSALASDQFTRLFDLAIDFCEDVPPLKKEDINQIVSIFKKNGATAKVSSIHVNGWFGHYDKKSMCETFFKNRYKKKLKDQLHTSAFIGDSPNDEPMFAFFENSVAVANILDFKEDLNHLPKFVTANKAGDGFVEFGEKLLNN